MKTLALITTALGLTTLLAACSNDPANMNDNSSNFQQELMLDNITAIPADSLSDAELTSLEFMVEEEKVARDVYIQLYSKWGLKPFSNISGSEQQHIDAVSVLLERYEIALPTTLNQVGAFTNQTLQTLHDDLLEQGNVSLIDGLKVGALIEEVDIQDLENALENSVNNEDIIYVYQNLIKGSENHLRAYVKNLSRQGVIYSPQVLDISRYSEIID